MTNILRSGEQLNYDDKLVSPNGRYTLWMQSDGNLVLYHDQIDAATAYWSTSTWNLPAAEKPTCAVLQSDVNFVLYDANKSARWASGTWGPGYVDPYLVLQDDGNLVIYHDGTRPVWATGNVVHIGALNGCGYLPAPARGDLNAAIDPLGRMPPVVVVSGDLKPPMDKIADAAGVPYKVTEQRRQFVNDVIEHAFLEDIGAMGIWPGQVIQGRPLLGGDPAPIGPFSRRGGTIGISTDLILGNPGPLDAKLDHPDAASVNQARRDILNVRQVKDSPGLLRGEFKQASTLREIGVKAGLAIKGSAFSVDANASLNQSFKTTTVVAVYRQVFYSVTFSPDGAGATGIWGPDVTFDQLSNYMSPDNPPLYVDSVQYGRLIVVTATAAHSSVDLSAAMNLHYAGNYDVKVNGEITAKEMVESSSVNIYTIGVPGRIQFQHLNDAVNDLADVYKSGLVFDLTNPGAPISFTCRHIADNTQAHIGLVAQYDEILSAVGMGDVTDATYLVWDGPGGGSVDTRIPANPGDAVTISASGQTWGGAFYGLIGPEGWAGSKAGDNYPLPQAPNYCLIARFGGGGNQDGWIAVGRHWEGTLDAKQKGILQLNLNDDNPYNGGADRKWQVIVNVKRGNAAAAGVYV
jgi:hypothetical protein